MQYFLFFKSWPPCWIYFFLMHIHYHICIFRDLFKVSLWIICWIFTAYKHFSTLTILHQESYFLSLPHIRLNKNKTGEGKSSSFSIALQIIIPSGTFTFQFYLQNFLVSLYLFHKVKYWDIKFILKYRHIKLKFRYFFFLAIFLYHHHHNQQCFLIKPFL